MVPASQPTLWGKTMSNRWKLWLGASALAMASGAVPGLQVLSPVTTGLAGIDLVRDAGAQDSGDEAGEGDEAGAETDCTTESGEGDEGGSAECPEPTGEEGEGESG